MGLTQTEIRERLAEIETLAVKIQGLRTGIPGAGLVSIFGSDIEMQFENVELLSTVGETDTGESFLHDGEWRQVVKVAAGGVECYAVGYTPAPQTKAAADAQEGQPL